MQVEPPISYRGALQLLGRHDRPVFDALNALLGGVLVASPLFGAAALFGWIDQKNEAMTVLRGLLDKGKDRLLGTNGHERQQLIAAAHTVIVMSALFDVVHELQAEKSPFGRQRLTELLLEVEPDRTFIEWLYTAPVPAPSASRGFHEILPEIDAFGSRAVTDLTIMAGITLSPGEVDFTDAFRQRYTASYLRLMADVPEFQMWAALGEHAATRDTIRSLHAGLGQVLAEQATSLGRLERLMRYFVGNPGAPVPGLVAALNATNSAALQEAILPADTIADVPYLEVPTVSEIHQTPRFRAVRYASGDQPSDDGWWTGKGDRPEKPVRDDLELFLAAHLASEESTRLPLLLLGHPGAGKSLLTKVLAARLPAESFTVVRVPLRRVDSGAPIYTQVAQALDSATHGRVTWQSLDGPSAGTIRVVLLDGFDELLQALPAGRRGYLQDIMEFQRLEAAQGAPVAVVVTSRTIVADRATIPPGAPVVRLEEFGEHEIARWLEVWNSANALAISGGRIRPLPPDDALAYPDLVTQPLLLLLLALYVADPATTLDRGLSTAALYERLFTTFLRRDVAKLGLGDGLPREVDERLWRLTVAAFGMFNRGGVYIMDSELSADLAAFEGEPYGERARGQRTVGEFFFVHASEADAHRRGDASRCFEFLHATFGEYLIARYVVRQLDELADVRSARRVDDDELFAMLSHQPLLGRRQILDFAIDIVEHLPSGRWQAIAALLERLAATVRDRHDTERLRAYRPQRTDRLRAMAAYSVNLVALRVYLDPHPDGVPITAFAPLSTDPLAWWRSTVTAWRAGLDDGGWAAVVLGLDLADKTAASVDARTDYEWPVDADALTVVRRSTRWAPESRPAAAYAQLTAQPAYEQDLRVGESLRGFSYVREEDFSEPGLIAWTVASAMNGLIHEKMFLNEVLTGLRSGRYDHLRADTAEVRRWLVRLLMLESGKLNYTDILTIVRYVITDPTIDIPDLVFVVAGIPRLLHDEPALLSYFHNAGPETKSLLGVLKIARRGTDDATARALREAAGNAPEYNGSGGSALLELVIRLNRAVA
ncbi:NACHT domain-containing protein [Micromonospora azadirachtae]|uniref:NACHT domain-containing protein n=1 Tax=Micromonospora azadirachtae TaxID=1970735 RepID=A0ABW2ZUM5_9ACTN